MTRISSSRRSLCAIASSLLWVATLLQAVLVADEPGGVKGKTPEPAANADGDKPAVDKSDDDTKSKKSAAKAAPGKASAAGKGGAKLTPRQITFVKKELIPIVQAGEPLSLLNLLAPQVAKLSEPHREGMDALLAEQGAPNIARLLTNARLELFRNRADKTAPELSLAEAVLIVGDTAKQIEELLAGTKKASFMADPLPKPDTLLGYRDLLFDVHVQKNELINALQLIEFGRSVAGALPEAKTKIATDAQREVLGTSFASYTVQIKDLERDMEERTLELRLDRLDLAITVLSTASGLKDKFFAAYAVGIDGEFLLAGFKSSTTAFRRPALNNEQIVVELERKVERGKILAGNLLDKSRALFVGLHWWRRGRYGRGPEGMGLLKSVAATKSFAASVPLMMPVSSPVPTNPAQAGRLQVPDYDRRHHYIWAWEDRQFQVQGTGSESSTSTQEIGRRSAGTSYFY